MVDSLYDKYVGPTYSYCNANYNEIKFGIIKNGMKFEVNYKNITGKFVKELVENIKNSLQNLKIRNMFVFPGDIISITVDKLKHGSVVRISRLLDEAAFPEFDMWFSLDAEETKELVETIELFYDMLVNFELNFERLNVPHRSSNEEELSDDSCKVS